MAIDSYVEYIIRLLSKSEPMLEIIALILTNLGNM
jgi:hypothetical protein